MVKNLKTLLSIGDTCDFETFKKFKRTTKKATGFKYLNIKYDKVLLNKLPKIKTNEIVIFFFFPFNYWDNHIETKRYQGVYGKKEFFNKFVFYCNKISKIIKFKYKDKKIFYIIPPDKMYIDRDKELTKKILKRFNVPVPKTIKSRNIKDIKVLLKKKGVFIKPNFGAMGKGITYLSKDKWLTNFRFSSGKIKSKKSDYGWTFKDITDDDNFLKELLKQNITIEEEIPPYLINGRKFDLRVYVSFGKVRYIYPRTNDSLATTTNISQGGKGENQSFLKKIPKNLLKDAKIIAIKAAKAIGVNFVGVDIMFNGKTKKGIVIEVNCFPGFPKSRMFNLSKIILQDIKQEFLK